jgi:predicted Rossmann-fold nucleotide-binding protein
MSRTIIGVMGPGTASGEELAAAEALGRGIAQAGWWLLCSRRAVGVMEAASWWGRRATAWGLYQKADFAEWWGV